MASRSNSRNSSNNNNNYNNNNNNNNNNNVSVNPHLIEFLQQQIDTIKNNPGSDIKKTSLYKRAIHSLNLYPLPIFSGKECEVLSGFGPSLSKQVDRFLKDKSHPLYPNGPPTPLKLIYSRSSNITINSNDNDNNNNEDNITKKKRQRKTKSNDENSQDNTNSSKSRVSRTKPSKLSKSPLKTIATRQEDQEFELIDSNINDQSFNFDFGSFDINNNNSNDNNNSHDNKISSNNVNRIVNKDKIITPIKSYCNNKFNDSIIFSPLSPFNKIYTPLSNNKKRKHQLISSPYKYNNIMRNAFSPKRTPSKDSTPLKRYKFNIENNKENIINNNINSNNNNKQSTQTPKSKIIGHSYIMSDDENNENDINIINNINNINNINKINNINNNTLNKNKSILKPIRLSFVEDDLLNNKNNNNNLTTTVTTTTKTNTTTKITTTTTNTTSTTKKTFYFKEIKCFVDNREIKSVKERDFIVNKLKENGINAEIKKLELGDFIWVAIDDKGGEWLLNYILERKRIDDLSSSIMDGRYKEQKFRLTRTGCKSIIYLVEGIISNNIMLSQQYKKWGSVNFGLSPDALSSALISTQINDGITIKQTKSLDETIEFITLTTQYIKEHLCKFLTTSNSIHLETLKKFLYKGDIEQQYTIENFNQSNIKSKGLPLLEFFATQLMQIPGISAEKAHTIINYYPTPYSLYIALKRFKSDDQNTATTIFKDLEFGKSNRKFGSEISERLFKIYNN